MGFDASGSNRLRFSRRRVLGAVWNPASGEGASQNQALPPLPYIPISNKLKSFVSPHAERHGPAPAMLTIALPRPTSPIAKVLTHSVVGGGKPITERLQSDSGANLSFDDMDCSAEVESHLKNIAGTCGYKEPSKRPKMDEVRRDGRGQEIVMARGAHFAFSVVCDYRISQMTGLLTTLHCPS